MLGATATDECSGIAEFTRVPAGDLFPIGVTTVTWTASDAAMNSSTATQTVTVLGAFDQAVNLTNYVNSLPLDAGIKTSLVAILNAANDAMLRNRTTAACAQLQAFLRIVNSQAGKEIPVEQAQQMIEAANRISAVLGCR
jgi:hypothetical protein